MSSFECEYCKTLIHDTPAGHITGCEHHPMEKLIPQQRNKRSDFLRILAELAREQNPVTRSVQRGILKERLDMGDLS